MSKSGKITKGPFWSQNWFEAMWRFTCNNFVNFDTGAVDFEALGREEYEFRKALFFRNFKNSKRARAVFDEAKAEYDKKVENGMKGGRPKKNPQDAPNGNAGEDMSDARNGAASKSPTSCDQFTADGDIREDSQARPDGSAITRNETRAHDALEPSANLYGDAATREGAEDCHHPINGAISRPTTVSKNVSTPTISTNRRRTGGPSLSQTSSLTPVRQSEPDVMSLAYSGEFGNVRLTQEQYAELGIKFGNQQKLNRAIDSLSCKLENGETNPRNHYAELVKWANYRDDMDEKEELKASSAPHYETVSEHNARIVRESDKWIDEYYSQKRKAANGK